MKNLFLILLPLVATICCANKNNENNLFTNCFSYTSTIPICSEEITLRGNDIFLNIGNDLYIEEIANQKKEPRVTPTYDAWYCHRCKHHTFYPLKKCMWCKKAREFPEDEGEEDEEG